MKYIYILFLMLLSFCGFSQTVTQAEYFWDSDPGEGNGTTLQALDGNFNQSLETVFSNNASLPSIGNHTIGIRIKDQEGNWSSIFRKTFRVAANNSANNTVKITAAEYFWDNDPGDGAGNVMLAFDGNFNQALETVLSNNTALPAIGDHVIGIRVKGDDGNWGITYRKMFRVSENNNSNNQVKVTTAEYFWDNDPGEGIGTTMLAFDGNFTQALESILKNDVALPSIGNHIIGIRVKADDGNWGTTFRKVFRVSENNNSNNQVKVTTAEYFWDNDPGEGIGTTMLAFDGNFTQALESILKNDVALPSIGNHIIGIRVKADDGNWGTTFRKVFRVSEINNSNTIVKITQAEYFWNNDPGQGSGNTMIAFDGNFNQALESIVANNATFPNPGLNVLHVRVKADDGNWGIVYSKVVGLDITYDNQAILTSPNNGASAVPLTSSFVWEQLTGIGSYEYQCATDSQFLSIVQTGILFGTTVAFSNLSTNTLYYWRVRANVNGEVSLWSDVWSFTTNSVLSNTDFENENQILVYPNPTSQYIYIQSKNAPDNFDFTINTMDGKEVLSGRCSQNMKINLENSATGTYIVKIKNSLGNFEYIKVIKI